VVAYSAGANGEGAAATVGTVTVGDEREHLVSSQRGGFIFAREGSVVGPSAGDKKQPS
jgi:hypothetical protein